MVLTVADCWLIQMLKIQTFRHSEYSDSKILKCVHSKFQQFWKDHIKSFRIQKDGMEQKKNCTYYSFKCHFSIEPNVLFAKHLNERCHLSSLRVSANKLGREVKRYQQPPIHRDNECHCLTACFIGKEDCNTKILRPICKNP